MICGHKINVECLTTVYYLHEVVKLLSVPFAANVICKDVTLINLSVIVGMGVVII